MVQQTPHAMPWTAFLVGLWGRGLVPEDLLGLTW